MRRWMSVLRTPLGLAATGADGRRAGARRGGADPLDRRGERRRHQQHPRRTVRRPLGRHRQPRARHLLPHAGGDPPLGRARARRDRDRRGRRPGPRHGGVPARPPVRPAGQRRHQHRGRLPRHPARALLRGRLRGRCDRRGARDRLRRRPGVRPPHPDPRGRRRRPRLRLRGAGRRRRPGAHPVPSRAAEHLRAAGRQRHHRRRRRAARLRRAVVPRPRRAAAPVRLGPAAVRRHRLDLRQPGRGARARHRRARRRARVQPVRRVRRQGARCRCRRRNPRTAAVPRRAGERDPGGRSTAGPTGCRRRALRPCPAALESESPLQETHHAGSDLVLDVRDLEVTFPGPDGPIRPVRGVSFAVRRGEAVGDRGGVRLRQVAHRARGLPAGRRRRPRRRHPARAARHTTCGPRTRRCSAGCSAPRWPWSSRTR